jgi:cytochrome P450
VTRLQVDSNFFDPAYLENPYPFYDEIRAVGNIVWNDIVKGWVIVGFDEATTVMADGGEKVAILSGDPEITFWFEGPNMIAVDGLDHKRLRGALAPLFTRAATAKWEARVSEVVKDLLAPLVSGSDSFDLISDFTVLPTLIVSEMLGVPQNRQADFQRWSHDIVTNLAFGLEDEGSLKVLRRAATEINEFLREEIKRHEREQTDDLFTYMTRLEGDSAMSADEIRSTAVLLLAAGYDTTAKAMSNTLIALERNPDQRRLVAEDLSLVPAAIEESLRWYGPVQWNPRKAKQNMVLGGQAISAGEVLYPMNAAANRDPRRWPEPDRFDVHREPKTHLAFGYGPHLCLGAPLARLEAKVAIQELLRLAPNYHLRDLDFGKSMFVRGPERGVIDVAGSAADI